MKKSKYFLLAISLLTSGYAFAQISSYPIRTDYIGAESLNEINNKVLKNCAYILDVVVIDDKLQSTQKKGQVDVVVKAKVRHILRGRQIKKGDTIIVVMPDVANGTDSMYMPHSYNGYPDIMFKINNELFGELLLQLPSNDFKKDLPEWNGKMVFELYRSNKGFCSIVFQDGSITDKNYEVWALFGLKFKTRQEWYNYLKQYPDIEVPEGY